MFFMAVCLNPNHPVDPIYRDAWGPRFDIAI